MEGIAFGTDGWRATLEEFTTDRVRMVAQAIARHLRESGPDAPVAVGYDARETSPGFAEDVASVLADAGFDVLVPGRDCPTPVVAWTVTDRNLAGAVMVTASHNPPEYNGVKFIPADGAPARPTVTDDLESKLARPVQAPPADRGTIAEVDLFEPYLSHARSFVEADLSGLTVAYDAMHGSGRGVTDRLLSTAKATVTRVRCNHDPTFGGMAPEPTADRLVPLVEAVVDGPADLGLANDGDADRLAVVTPNGYLDPNLLYGVLYDYLLENAAGDAVRTVSTTFLIDRIATAHNQQAHETAVGFKWVAGAMAEYDALVGGEESGGFGLTAHLRNKDGVLLALIVAAAAAADPIEVRVERLLAEHGEVHQDRRSLPCADERKQPVLDRLEADLPSTLAGTAVESVNDVDGFKIRLTDGSWLLIRPSGTEPKLRLYAEATSESEVAALLEEGRYLVEPLIGS